MGQVLGFESLMPQYHWTKSGIWNGTHHALLTTPVCKVPPKYDLHRILRVLPRLATLHKMKSEAERIASTPPVELARIDSLGAGPGPTWGPLLGTPQILTSNPNARRGHAKAVCCACCPIMGCPSLFPDFVLCNIIVVYLTGCMAQYQL